jgi:hypothetical protein
VTITVGFAVYVGVGVGVVRTVGLAVKVGVLVSVGRTVVGTMVVSVTLGVEMGTYVTVGFGVETFTRGGRATVGIAVVTYP